MADNLDIDTLDAAALAEADWLGAGLSAMQARIMAALGCGDASMDDVADVRIEGVGAKAMDTATAEAFTPATQRGREWREDLHPRHPAGTPEGGEFAPKEGPADLRERLPVLWWANLKFGPEAGRNFAEWFGHSVVVDEFDVPRVMYHATKADFTAFRLWASRGAIFLSTTPEGAWSGAQAGAREFGGDFPTHIMPVYLRVNKLYGYNYADLPGLPDVVGRRVTSQEDVERDIKEVTDALNARKFSDNSEVDKWARAIAVREWHEHHNLGPTDPADKDAQRWVRLERPVEYRGRWQEIKSLKEQATPWQIFERGPYPHSSHGTTIAALRALGYDGAVIADEGSKNGGWTIAVFDPTQIKSAIGNSGRFDPNDPDATKGEWREELHPRAPAGTEAGGEFIAKDESGPGPGSAVAMPIPASFGELADKRLAEIVAMSDEERHKQDWDYRDTLILTMGLDVGRAMGDPGLGAWNREELGAWYKLARYVEWRTGVHLTPRQARMFDVLYHEGVFTDPKWPAWRIADVSRYTQDPLGSGAKISEVARLNSSRAAGPDDMTPERWAAVQRGLELIDQVHGDGEMSPVWIDERKKGLGNVGGESYAFEGIPRITVTGGVSTTRDDYSYEQVIVHEMGHTLDGLVLGAASMRWRGDPVQGYQLNIDHAVRQGEIFDRIPEGKGFTRDLDGQPEVQRAARRLMDTINASDRIRRLSIFSRGNLELSGASPYIDTSDRYQKWVKSYLLDPSESFARAYTQYIATKTGDPRLTGPIRARAVEDHERGKLPDQWEDKDFAPIAEAFDDLFRAKGWLKESPAAKGEWREELHPRHPAGSAEGGEFAPKDGAGGDSGHGLTSADEDVPAWRTEWPKDSTELEHDDFATRQNMRWNPLMQMGQAARWKAKWERGDVMQFHHNPTYRAGMSELENIAAFAYWRTGEKLSQSEALGLSVLWEMGEWQVTPMDIHRYVGSPAKAGAPMREALDISRLKGPARAEAERAVALMDQVHTDGEMGRIAVETSSRLSEFNNGLSYGKGGFNRIVLAPASRRDSSSPDDSIAATLVHETGHMLDFAALGGGTIRYTESDQRYAGWLKDRQRINSNITRSTPEVERAFDNVMEEIRATTLVANAGEQLRVGSFDAGGTKVPLTGRYRSYVAQYVWKPEEVFARAYTQYIATKTGDPQLKAAIASRQVATPRNINTQWQDGDFAPVAQAFDELFRAKGWLKESPAAKGEWREELHPRHPAGSAEGGEFAPKDGPQRDAVGPGFEPEDRSASEIELDEHMARLANVPASSRHATVMDESEWLGLKFGVNTPMGRIRMWSGMDGMPPDADRFEKFAAFLKWRTGADLTVRQAEMFYDLYEADGNYTVKPRDLAKYTQRPVGPGAKVSDAFEMAVNMPARDAENLREGLAAIDKVHGDGELPRFVIDAIAASPLSDAARGSCYASMGIQKIEIAAGASLVTAYDESQAGTIVHEVGHALDSSVFAGLTEAWGTSDADFEGESNRLNSRMLGKAKREEAPRADAPQRVSALYRDEILRRLPESAPREIPSNQRAGVMRVLATMNRSRLVKGLYDYAAGDAQTFTTDRGETVQPGLRHKHFVKDYLLNTSELFARGYAQWIGLRSRSKAVQRSIRDRQRTTMTSMRSQWDDDDFAPIAAAFDDLFRAKGWLHDEKPGRSPATKAEWIEAIDAAIRAAKGEWREELHPRHPAGSAEGGEFAPKGGGFAATDNAEREPVDPELVRKLGEDLGGFDDFWDAMGAAPEAARHAVPWRSIDAKMIVAWPGWDVPPVATVSDFAKAMRDFVAWRTGDDLTLREAISLWNMYSTGEYDFAPADMHKYCPPPAKPGTPIRDVVDVSRLPADLIDDAREAVQAIDGVHGDGDMGQVIVELSPASIGRSRRQRIPAGSAYATVGMMRVTLSDLQNMIDQDTDPVGNLVHEMGHTIEATAFNRRTWEWSEGRAARGEMRRLSPIVHNERQDWAQTHAEWAANIAPRGAQPNTPEVNRAFDGVLSALNDSASVKMLFRIAHDPNAKYEDTGGGKRKLAPKYRDWVRNYMLNPAEVFARGYTQYIAVRSGNSKLLAGVKREAVNTPKFIPSQWQDDDFEPIAKAFDDLFRAKGWLKEPPAAKGEWREELHPREPSGTEEGGQFAPKGGPQGTMTGGPTDPEDRKRFMEDANFRHEHPLDYRDWMDVLKGVRAPSGEFVRLGWKEGEAPPADGAPERWPALAKYLKWRTGVDLTPDQAKIYSQQVLGAIMGYGGMPTYTPDEFLDYMRPPLGPGSPMSKAVYPSPLLDSKIAADLRQAMNIVDWVHGDGEMPPFKVENLPGSQSDGRFGESHGHAGVQLIRIASPRRFAGGPNIPKETIIHELGHAIEAGVFATMTQDWPVEPGDLGGVPMRMVARPRNMTAGLTMSLEGWTTEVPGWALPASAPKKLEPRVAKAFSGVMRAINNSRSVVDMHDLRTNPERDTVMGMDGKEYPVSARWKKGFLAETALNSTELFARGYVQWVATRSRDPELVKVVRTMAKGDQTLIPSQWHDDDFEPIAKAFDDLFRAKGWLKESPAAKGEWREELHPRAPAGTEAGGEFIAKDEPGPGRTVTAPEPGSLRDVAAKRLAEMAALGEEERHARRVLYDDVLPFATNTNVGAFIGDPSIGVFHEEEPGAWENLSKYLKWRTGVDLTPRQAHIFRVLSDVDRTLQWTRNDLRDLARYTLDPLGKGASISQVAQLNRWPAFTSQMTDDEWDEVEGALDSIDRVHGDGEMPPVWIEEKYDDGSGVTGQAFGANGVPLITISSLGKSLDGAFTVSDVVVHEMGHTLDALVFGNETLVWGVNHGHDGAKERSLMTVDGGNLNYVMEPRPEAKGIPRDLDDQPEVRRAFGRVMSAMNNSQAVRALHAYSRGDPYAGLPEGFANGERYQKWVKSYLLNSSELFARAYTQYIGTKTGDMQINHTVNFGMKQTEHGLPTQWLPGDFVPIADAFDDLFRAKGWLRDEKPVRRYDTPPAGAGPATKAEWIEAIDAAIRAAKGEWREDLHPRHPAGSSEGGEFAPKVGGPQYNASAPGPEPVNPEPNSEPENRNLLWEKRAHIAKLTNVSEATRHKSPMDGKDWLGLDSGVHTPVGFVQLDQGIAPDPDRFVKLAEYLKWRTGVDLTPRRAEMFYILRIADGDDVQPADVLRYTREPVGEGAKVSDAFSTGPNVPSRDSVDLYDGLAAIDKVHGDGELPRFVIDVATGSNPLTEQAAGTSYASMGAQRITVAKGGTFKNEDAVTQAATIVHEVGHALDSSVFAGATETWGVDPSHYGTEPNRLSSKFLKLHDTSEPVSTEERQFIASMYEKEVLRQLPESAPREIPRRQFAGVIRVLSRMNSSQLVKGLYDYATGESPNFRADDGKLVEAGARYKAFVGGYLLNTAELFARGYAQWIGLRSGNAAIRKSIQHGQRSTQMSMKSQWEDKDFEPIAEAFDLLFMEKGWLDAGE